MIAEAREQVGKYEFAVRISEKKPNGEQRVNALKNWLLVEWERAANHINQKPKGNLFGRN